MKRLFRLFFLILCLAPHDAAAFPEFVRLGYHSCKACHYSPSGGGQINKYGRAIAGSELSTWGTPEQAETFFGAFNLEPLDLAGHSRYLYHHYEDDQVRVNQRFFMERSLSLAWNPAQNITLLMSGGLYGPDPDKVEYRTYYGIAHIGPAWVRAGRFLAAFGTEVDDHTLAIKQLLGQGGETANIEVGYSQKYFELSLTRVFGEMPSIELTDEPTFRQVEDWDGYTGKLNLFLAKGLQLGVSQAFTDNGTKQNAYTAYHGFAGWKKLYAMAEYQVHPGGQNPALYLVGIEPYKGIHIRSQFDVRPDETEIFGELRFFPVPHVDLQFKASNKQQMAVVHFYL